ncbi:MAG: RNA polymerase sigma factor [Spirochaetes bacterium]|nr:RNA polymerase sigma factor [Spirochaetota bacterium]
MSEQISDKEIVERVRKGDYESFSILIERYLNRVVRYVRAKFDNPDEVMDVTQDIFMMAFESLESFRGDSKFSTWLFSITANYCKNYRRKLNKIKTFSIEKAYEETGELPIADERINTEQAVIDSDSLRIVKEELYKLPEDYREILILRDIEGLSYNEIAEVLGITLANVKVRIHRAREQLKERLQEKGLL